ncbi:MAG: ABC transporter permease [Deltaproteobacteria bacterium]|jgi:peptide/nickel transport system permease protein
MLVYLARRLTGLGPLFLGITFVSFIVIHLAPGSPMDLLTDMNPDASPELRQRLEAHWGLGRPLPVQYGLWLKKLATGDLGVSMSRDARPVLDKITEALPVTLLLNAMSLCLILAMAIPIGVYSATHQYSTADRVTTVAVFLGFAMPTFWLALLCMMFFGVELGWLPVSGLKSLDHDSLGLGARMMDRARHLIMPVGVAAVTSLAGMSRYMRSSMLEVFRQDYVTTARAKGLTERVVVYRHAMRNALLPVITILGLSIPGLVGGSVIFETIFAIPGMGRLFYGAVMSRDYTVVMGVLVIGALLTLVGNLLADIMYAVADPRLRRR